jgi:hypothetical protein
MRVLSVGARSYAMLFEKPGRRAPSLPNTLSRKRERVPKAGRAVCVLGGFSREALGLGRRRASPLKWPLQGLRPARLPAKTCHSQAALGRI